MSELQEGPSGCSGPRFNKLVDLRILEADMTSIDQFFRQDINKTCGILEKEPPHVNGKDDPHAHAQTQPLEKEDYQGEGAVMMTKGHTHTKGGLRFHPFNPRAIPQS